MKRRTFLQTSTLLGASLGATAKAASSEPLIIATWKNEKATIAGWNKLMETGKALDGVEAGARIPEADPNDTSVGYGGYPDRDGHVTLDACIMDHLGNAGSVTFLEGIMHPISVARAVMEKTPHVMLSGAGALKFALDQGFKVENLLTESSKKAWEEWKKESKYEPVINIERHDTIGLLGIGKAGEIAGACTTSGLAFKMHGRVGDSPIIGAGLYVDNEVGAVVATGQGEDVIRVAGASAVVEWMRQGKSPEEACKLVVEKINRIKKEKAKDIQVCFVAINKAGKVGAYSLQKGFNFSVHNLISLI